MSKAATQAQAAAEKLLKADESQLYEILGMRAKAIAADPATAGSFDPTVAYDESLMGIRQDVIEFGQRLFRRWSVEAYGIICGEGADDQSDRKELAEAFGLGDAVVAGAITTALVSGLGLAPAVAAVIAALLVKRFFRPGCQEFCAAWKKHLPSPS
jgi:hypothetical protein